MNDLRKYGKAPFNVALIHGGPGAAGEMAPVARELASRRGVLEPLQTAASLEGQIEELRTTLTKNADSPVTLVGFSWGAWLSYMVAARYPAHVRKLILVGSGPYQEHYAKGIQATRLKRLNEQERAEFASVLHLLENAATADKRAAFARLGALCTKADAYDPLILDPDVIDWHVDVFQNIWTEAEELRRSGKLLELGARIECPVIAIHGDHDPHPAEGVRRPLSATLKSFRFILLHNCGHKPWIERYAKNRFYSLLQEELCMEE